MSRKYTDRTSRWSGASTMIPGGNQGLTKRIVNRRSQHALDSKAQSHQIYRSSEYVRDT